MLVLSASLAVYAFADAAFLVINRNAGMRPDVTREALKLCFFLYCLVLLRLTEFQHVRIFGWEPRSNVAINLVPFRVIAREIGSIARYGVNQRSVDINLYGNILLLLPLGLLAPALWPRFRSCLNCLLLGAAVSICIESAQYVLTSLGFVHRMADVDDVLLNTLGAVVGYGAYLLLRFLLRKSLPARSDRYKV